MTTTLRLGPQVRPLNVQLWTDGSWWSTLTSSDGPWPAGVEIELRFPTQDSGEIVWAADVSNDSASWSISEQDVAEVIAEEPRTVMLWYVDNTTKIPWASGSVQVDD